MVVPATPFLTLEEMKPFWGSDETYRDELITALIAGACNLCEHHIGRPVVARELNRKSHGGKPTIRLTKEVFSIASVTERGVALTSADYAVDAKNGVLYRLSDSYTPGMWAEGVLAVDVTYTAGVAATVGDVPEDLKTSIRICVKFWLKVGPEDFARQLGSGMMLKPEQIPGQARFLWDSYKR